MLSRTTIRFLSAVPAAALLAAALMAATAASVKAEVIDRIVAIIDHKVLITLSDIRKEQAIQTALGRKAEDDEKTVKSLIEKHLFRQQIALFREIEIDEDAVTRQLRGVQIPPSVSADDIRNTIREEFQNNEFVVQRFRPFVKVTDEEVRDTYEKVVLPAYRAAGTPLPPADEGMQTARTAVIADKMDQEVGKWLEDLGRRVSIEKISK